MNTNPDINRLSLEDRIEALENRLPSGGGGQGYLPYVDPVVLENLRKDEFTQVDGGWCIKYDIPNTGNVPGSGLSGCYLRLAFFFPEIHGTVFAPSQVIASFTLTNPLQQITSSRTMAYRHTLTDLSFFDAVGIRDVTSFPNLWMTSNVLLLTKSSATTFISQTANLQLTRGASSTGIQLYLGLGSAGGQGTSLQGTSCGVFFSQPVSLGCLPGIAAPGGNPYIGGMPTSFSGYCRNPGATVSHPISKYLPQSWR